MHFRCILKIKHIRIKRIVNFILQSFLIMFFKKMYTFYIINNEN